MLKISFFRRFYNRLKYGLRAQRAKEKEIGVISVAEEDRISIKWTERQDTDKIKPEYFRSNYWISSTDGQHRRIQIIPPDNMGQEQWKIVYRYNYLYGLKKEYDQSYIILPKVTDKFDEQVKKLFEEIGEFKKEPTLSYRTRANIKRQVDKEISQYPDVVVVNKEMRREMIQNRLQEEIWQRAKRRLRDYKSEKEVDKVKRIERLKKLRVRDLPTGVEQKLQTIMERHNVDREQAWDFY